MCDTIVALGNSTKDGHVLFAKNSDREPNEAHEVVIVPRAVHAAGEKVKCTYIEIPQVEETYQVLLAKPFWIWGAEMGANEFGVCIGNEAVFTKDPYGKEPGLIGMDFLRLGLERGKTARAALQVIIDLLEAYGQSGNCGFVHKFFYHNSFLIADPEEAWIWESSAKEWAARRVKDVGAISNAITIDEQWDMASANLVTHAVEMGWCKDATRFSFSRCYSEPLFTKFSDAKRRQECTTRSLKSQIGKIDASAMMTILRNHNSQGKDGWSPEKGITGADVCMHAAWGPIRGSQSIGSMVSRLDHSDSVHWLTGTSAPCTSLFKPIWLDCGLPKTGAAPKGVFDSDSLFWRHEIVHREILKDYAKRIELIKPAQSSFEKEMLKETEENLTSSYNQRKELSDALFAKAEAIEASWLKEVKRMTTDHRNPISYAKVWKGLNQQAGMPE